MAVLKVKPYHEEVELEIEDIADALAEESDSEQGEFFNRFGANLAGVGSVKFSYQLISIADKLDGDGKALIEQLAEFIKEGRKDGT